MTSDPFNFGPPPDNARGSQPGAPPPGSYGGGGNPFGDPAQHHPGASVPPGPIPQAPPAPDPQAQNPFSQNPQAQRSQTQSPLSTPRQPAGTGGAFGGPVTAGDLTAARPPAWLLFLAAGLAMIAGIIALVLNHPVIAIVCWVFAGPVAIGLLGLFVVKDTFARSSGLYAAPDWIKPVHYGAIVLCLVCILVPALRIADWVGRL